MKKVLIAVIAALLIFTMLSSLSMLPEGDGLLSQDGAVNDFIHNIGDSIKDKFDKDDGDSTKEPDSTDDVDKIIVHNENVFYWFDAAGNRKSSADISAIPNGTRGYFFSGDTAYFCIKSDGTGAFCAELNNDSSSFGDYTLIYLLISDMSDESTYEDHSDEMFAHFDEPRLIAYAAEPYYCDLIETYEDLGNYAIWINICDPITPEGPSAS